MLELRASGMSGRPVLASVDRPVALPSGTFLPRFDSDVPTIVLAVHPIDQGVMDGPAASASRSYLSQGLAAPESVLTPIGWLLDLTA